MEQRKILLSFLYGSQNYGLNNPDSDKDYLHIYMPNENDVFYANINKKIRDTEHDKYMSFPHFIKQVLKGNVNCWECIFSTAINIYTYDARNLLYFLQDNAQKILQHSAETFVKSAEGFALNRLNEYSKKQLSRAYYFALLAGKVVSDNMMMNCETWRNSQICYIPYLIRYSNYEEIHVDDVKNMFRRLVNKKFNFDNNSKSNILAVGKAEDMAKKLFFKEVL